MGTDKSHEVPSEKLNQPTVMVRYYLIGHRSHVTRAVSLIHPLERVKISAGPLVSKCQLRMFCQSSILGMNLSEALCEDLLVFPPKSANLDCEVVQALPLSSKVRRWLSVEAHARLFALSGTGVLHSLRCVLSGDAVLEG
jgi:hypothetical protein